MDARVRMRATMLAPCLAVVASFSSSPAFQPSVAGRGLLHRGRAQSFASKLCRQDPIATPSLPRTVWKLPRTCLSLAASASEDHEGPALDPRFEDWVDRSAKMSDEIEKQKRMASNFLALDKAVLYDQSGAQVDPKSIDRVSLGLLFSSGWCPACVSFAPVLKAFVEAQNEGQSKVQLIFVSSDESKADAQAVFKQSQGEWLMLDYDSPLRDEWKRRYGVWAGRETAKFADSIASFKARKSGIPAICVVDKVHTETVIVRHREQELEAFLDVEARGVESLLKWQPEEFAWE